MTARSLCWIGLCATLMSTVSFGADVPGSKDHPLLKRYEGSTILRYTAKAFDEYVLPLGPSSGRGNEVSLPKSMRLEGKVTRITYLAPAGRSVLEVVRNYESELKSAGYATVFTGADFTLGGDVVFKNNFAAAAGYRDIKVSDSSGAPTFADVVSKDQRFLAAKVGRPEGEVHVVVYATAILESLERMVPTDPSAAAYRPAAAGQVIFQVDVVEAKAMETKMVTVAAAEMAAGITRSGSIALYGILFDTNSADVKPESVATLQEIAKLLKSQPALKLLVVGHTDNVGTFESNMDLSQRRAASVVKALVSQHAVDQARLTPVGVSFASPVASNKAEEGRAKNRRVQLVER